MTEKTAGHIRVICKCSSHAYQVPVNLAVWGGWGDLPYGCPEIRCTTARITITGRGVSWLHWPYDLWALGPLVWGTPCRAFPSLDTIVFVSLSFLVELSGPSSRGSSPPEETIQSSPGDPTPSSCRGRWSLSRGKDGPKSWQLAKRWAGSSRPCCEQRFRVLPHWVISSLTRSF